MHYPSYIIDSKTFYDALERSGYGSIQRLAETVSIHRNTIHHFLSGASVFPDSILKILSALCVEPMEIIRRKEGTYGPDIIAALTDALLKKENNMCIVLFGSRARGNQKKFSDYDLGVYSRQEISHDKYLDLISCKEEHVEDLPVNVDLVNLNRADKYFLTAIKADARFLCGRLSDWLALKEKMHGSKA